MSYLNCLNHRESVPSDLLPVKVRAFQLSGVPYARRAFQWWEPGRGAGDGSPLPEREVPSLLLLSPPPQAVQREREALQ